MPHSTQEVQSQPGPSTRKRPTPPLEDHAFHYDPRQDPDERRALRSDYRTLISHAETLKRDPTLTPAALNELIDSTNELHKRVKAPSESILDSKPLAATAESAVRMAKKVRQNRDVFDTHQFVANLARFVGGTAASIRNPAEGRGARDEEDDESEEGGRRNINGWEWGKLAGLAEGLSKRAVTIDFMLGPLDMQRKARRAVTRTRVDEHAGERTAPRSLGQQDLQQTAGAETTSHIMEVAKLLGRQGETGVCLFRFAVDPESFVNTIENFFHISFLIKENKASLKTDEEGNAILCKFHHPSSFTIPKRFADEDIFYSISYSDDVMGDRSDSYCK